MTLSIILNISFMSLITLSCLISGLVLIKILIHIRSSRSNVSLLLASNTYLNTILLCFTLFDVSIHSLYGRLKPFISFAGRWCEIRAYFLHVCLCGFYYSFVLQATFRLFRVRFHKYKILQSFGVFIIAIFIQWMLSFILIIPHLLLNDFQYQLIDFNCWISFKNIRGMLLGILSIYGGPLSVIFIIYAYIMQYIRRAINIKRKRQKANKRDIIILRRILILLLFLVLMGVPTLCVLMIYIISNHLTPYVYDIQSLCISVGLVITPITLVFVTPKIRNLFRKKTRKNIERSSTVSTPSQQVSNSQN